MFVIAAIWLGVGAIVGGWKAWRILKAGEVLYRNRHTGHYEDIALIDPPLSDEKIEKHYIVETRRDLDVYLKAGGTFVTYSVLGVAGAVLTAIVYIALIALREAKKRR